MNLVLPIVGATGPSVQPELDQQVRLALDQKTKPPGSLGRLESLALQCAYVKNSPQPRMHSAIVMVFAASHGCGDELSAYPSAVTGQMVLNFLNGGAAINALCDANQVGLVVIDAGVDFVFEHHAQLINAKGPAALPSGTRNFLQEPAMTRDECIRAIQAGMVSVQGHAAQDMVALGEMGIGNTSSAAILMHAITHDPVMNCVGRGTGVNDEQLRNKYQRIDAAVKACGLSQQHDVLDWLAYFGGLEIAALVGAIIQAASMRKLILIDGFIVTAAALVATTLRPAVRDYMVFAHVSAEQAHGRMLAYLNAQPLLSMQMRLGEGTGAVLAVPIIRSACAILNQMATFESAGVSQAS